MNTLPKYTIDVNISNDLYPETGNLLTFNIKIKRGDISNNSNNKKELGFLHSNNYSDIYTEQAFVIIYDSNNKRIDYYEKIKFEYEYEEKNIEYDMLTEKNNGNNFEVYLISISYPGIIIKKNIEIDIKEENHLLNNFIKNRTKDLISIEEFRTNYGLEDNYEEIKESHEHNN